MTRPLRLGIAGLGTVGASVIRILARQDERCRQRGGRPVESWRVSARDRRKDRGIDLAGFTGSTIRWSWPARPMSIAWSS